MSDIKSYCVCYNRDEMCIQVILKGTRPRMNFLLHDPISDSVGEKVAKVIQEAEKRNHWFSLDIKTLEPKLKINTATVWELPIYLVFELHPLNGSAWVDNQGKSLKLAEIVMVLNEYRNKLDSCVSELFS